MTPEKYARAMGEVLKYAAEGGAWTPGTKTPASAIHPDLRFTRLGAVLREHSGENSTAGALARATLKEGGGLPLAMLRDHMIDEGRDHPLATKFNWERLPEKHELDKAVREAVAYTAASQPYFGELQLTDISDPSLRDEHRRVGAINARNRVKHFHPWATDSDISESIERLDDQNARREGLRDTRRFGEGRRRRTPEEDDRAHDRLANTHHRETDPYFDYEFY